MVNAFTGETDQVIWLGSGFDLQLQIAVEGRHNGIATEGGIRKRNFMVDDDINPLAFEKFVRTDRDGDVEVLITDSGAFAGAGGNLERVLLPLMNNIFGDAVDGIEKIDLQLILGFSRCLTGG